MWPMFLAATFLFANVLRPLKTLAFTSTVTTCYSDKFNLTKAGGTVVQLQPQPLFSIDRLLSGIPRTPQHVFVAGFTVLSLWEKKKKKKGS